MISNLIALGTVAGLLGLMTREAIRQWHADPVNRSDRMRRDHLDALDRIHRRHDT